MTKKIVAILAALIAAGCLASSGNAMQLEQENEAPIASPPWGQVEAALDALHPTRNAFVILSSKRADYIQTTGSKDRLTVEYRTYKGPGKEFSHFVLGRPGDRGDTTRIESNVGPVTVYENEVLTLADAKRAFRHFFETREVPEDYSLRDMTDRFK